MNQIEDPFDIIPTLSIDVEISDFKPLGIIPIRADFTKVTVPVGDARIFSVQDKNIRITTWPIGYSTVKIIFNFPDEQFIPIGLAFTGETTSDDGQGVFRHIRLETPNTKTTARTLTVVAGITQNSANVAYEYLILVQDLKGNQIGVIDPDIESSNVGSAPDYVPPKA